MIITCVGHGRRAADAQRLAKHLSKTERQTWRIADASGVNANLSLAEILADLRRPLAYAPRARVGLQHLTINPARSWTEAQRNAAFGRILDELTACDHGWVAVEHAGKARAMAGGAPTHYHLVVAHIGADGQALDLRGSYARLEAVARVCEHDFGEPATPSRRPAAVAAHLMRMGRSDVARALSRDAFATPPRSAMSGPGRQRAARLGVDLPAARAAVRAAWAAPDLAAALAASGLRIGVGDRRRIPVVRRAADGAVLGALDRLAGVSRADAIARLEAEMAIRKRAPDKGETDERNIRKGRPAAGPARRKNLARRGGDEVDDGGDSGHSDAGRRLPGPRFAGQNRSGAANASDDPAAARRRRQRALAELRRADSVARRRAHEGRAFEADVEAAKAALWRRIFGAELSPALVAALAYVDVRERLVTLTGGGWVRDEGDRLLASGADPRVVALMVEAAKAKGWRSVRVWGDAAFLAEALRQFAAAGIVVTVVEPPPPLQVEHDREFHIPARHDTDVIVAQLRRARIEAEERLARLSQPLPEPASLMAARADASVAKDALQAAQQRQNELSDEYSEAEEKMKGKGLLAAFAKGRARRRLADVERRYDASRAEVTALSKANDMARRKAERLQRDFERELAHRVKDREVAVHIARSDVALALECEQVATESPDLARRGTDAVEEVARARLKAPATERLIDADAPAEDDASKATPP